MGIMLIYNNINISLNWLWYSWCRDISTIFVDEMGLVNTLQAFIIFIKDIIVLFLVILIQYHEFFLNFR